MQIQAKSSASGSQEPSRPAEGTASIPMDSMNRSEENREQAIREMAYSFYEARGCVDGNDLDDWIKAEARVQELFIESAPTSI